VQELAKPKINGLRDNTRPHNVYVPSYVEVKECKEEHTHTLGASNLGISSLSSKGM